VHQLSHDRDLDYSGDVLKACSSRDRSVVVLRDGRVDWGIPGVPALVPDITVLFGVLRWFKLLTFHIQEEGGWPILAMAITSPSTYENDFGRKKDLYYQAGVQRYLIIDRRPRGNDPVSLDGLDHGPTVWIPMIPDAQGRLNLAPVPYLIGIENDQPWFYNPTTGERLLDSTEVRDRLVVAQQHARDAEAKTRDAEAKTRDEAQSRAVLEKRLRELEEQLQQRGGAAPPAGSEDK